MPLNMRWFPPCPPQFPGGRNDWNGQPVEWDWWTARATSNGRDSHCGFNWLTTRIFITVPTQALLQEVQFSGKYNRTFHHFGRRKPAKPPGQNPPNLSIWCDKRPVGRENQMPLFLSWGEGLPKNGGDGQFWRWWIDRLPCFWPHVRFQTIRKNNRCHTREVRQYPTKLHCAWDTFNLECLIRLGSLKFDGNYQYLQVRLSVFTRIYDLSFQIPVVTRVSQITRWPKRNKNDAKWFWGAWDGHIM